MANRATRCPHCQTSFRVTDSQLATARGRVRCGACLEVFNATENWVNPAPTQPDIPDPEPRFDDNSPLPEDESNGQLDVENRPAGEEWQPTDKKPEEQTTAGEQDIATSATTAGAPAARNPEDTGAADEKPSSAQAASVDTPPTSDRGIVAEASSVTASEPSDTAASGLGQPPTSDASNDNHDTDPRPASEPAADQSESQTEETDSADQAPLVGEDEFDALVAKQRRRVQLDRRQLGWTLLCLLAASALAGQAVYANFNSLAQSQHRAALTETCKVINWIWGERRCELPPPRNLARIESLGLNIMSHPHYIDSLLVDTVILNRAAFEQPFPQIELVFRNDRGNIVASRAFLPGEYLAGELRGATLMPVGQSVRINISIADPGSNAVNYEMRFLPAEDSAGR